MLFRRKIARSCTYCAWGTKLGEQQILCAKRGAVADSYACRKFVYDPCKRQPRKAKALDLEKFKDSDFTL